MLRRLLHRPAPIGLDIGHDSVKMLQLASRGGKLVTVAAARCPFPHDATVDPEQRRQFAAQAVRDTLSTGDFTGRRVVTCLGSEDLLVKQVRLPRMTRQELSKAVQWEANDRFGFTVSPEQLHYVVAGEVQQGSETREEIILLAARPETVQSHLGMLEEMKVFPVTIDAEPACLFRSFDRFLRRDADSKSVTLLMDIGSSATKVLAAYGRQVMFVKTITIGGWQLNEAVAERLGIDTIEASELRLQVMRAGEDDVVAAAGGETTYRALHDGIRRPAEELAREVNLCLRYCAVTFRGFRPDSITLLGGQAYDPCLREWLNEHLNVRCDLGRPLRGIDLSSADMGMQQLETHSEWAIAAGLALRQFPDSTHAWERDDERDRLSA